MSLKHLENLGDSYAALVVTGTDKLQDATNEIIRDYTKKKVPGIYVCFNKPESAVRKILEDSKIDTEKIFFIDCITTSMGEPKGGKNVLHISNPSDLTGLGVAIREFMDNIPSDKFLVMDSLSTLLIYNTENTVVKFVKSVVDQSQQNRLKTTIFTTVPKGGNFMNKISLFFDKVIEK